MTNERTFQLRAARAAVMAVLLLTAGSRPAPAGPALPDGATSVRVERVKPHKERHETLRFLQANRDFLRGELDRLRDRAVKLGGDATALDPRFLAYRLFLADAHAAQDSAALAEDARQRRTLLTSVTQLGDLETQLDQMDRALARQRDRLGVLQRDFTGDQRTALAVVLTGWPTQGAPSGFAVTLEDGTTMSVPLTDPQKDALRHGGAVKVFHRLVEPREQVVDLGFVGDGWPTDDHGYVRLEPTRDRLMLLRLDLTSLTPIGGAGSLVASTWLHDDRTP